MQTSTETNKILPALLKLKKELLPVTKGSDNPFFKSKYADLNVHLDAVEPLAEALGLILTQATGLTEVGLNYVETRLTHAESGQYVASSLVLVLNKQTMQEMGSAVTYARRYTLGSLLGMKAVDDDGNLASGKEVVKKTFDTGYNASSTTSKIVPATTTAKSSFRKAKKTDVNSTAITSEAQLTKAALLVDPNTGNVDNGGWE